MRTATLTKLLSVSVTKQMFEQVKSVADSDNVSAGQIVRAALDYALLHRNEWRNIDIKTKAPFSLCDPKEVIDNG